MPAQHDRRDAAEPERPDPALPASTDAAAPDDEPKDDEAEDIRRHSRQLADQSKLLKKRASRRIADSEKLLDQAEQLLGALGHRWMRIAVGRVCTACDVAQADGEFDDTVACDPKTS